MATGQSFSRVELLGGEPGISRRTRFTWCLEAFRTTALFLPVCLTQREDRLARSTTCDRIQYGVFFTLILSRDSCCAGYWRG